jgi:hypothetical protein
MQLITKRFLFQNTFPRALLTIAIMVPVFLFSSFSGLTNMRPHTSGQLPYIAHLESGFGDSNLTHGEEISLWPHFSNKEERKKNEFDNGGV